MFVFSYLLALIRAIFLLTGMLIGLLFYYLWLPFVKDSSGWGIRVRQWWIKGALRILNIHIDQVGSPPDCPGLVVCNHLSMMDPIILLSTVRAHPLSKAELAAYPIIGHAAKATGVLFVHRTDQKSRVKARHALREKLEENKCLLVFPEGTVGNGEQLLPFKPGSFYMAAETGQSVYPVHIAYSSSKDIWQKEDSLWMHFRKQFGKWKTEVYLSFGPPKRHDSGDVLRTYAEEFIGHSMRSKKG